jgi:hypothetical protein
VEIESGQHILAAVAKLFGHVIVPVPHGASFSAAATVCSGVIGAAAMAGAARASVAVKAIRRESVRFERVMKGHSSFDV